MSIGKSGITQSFPEKSVTVSSNYTDGKQSGVSLDTVFRQLVSYDTQKVQHTYLHWN